MFILPALLYLKVLLLFGQCLYHFIVSNKSRPPHASGAANPAGPLSALHPSRGGWASVGIVAPHQREDVWSSPTYDLTCNRPNTRRIFSGIGFGTLPVPKAEILPLGHCGL
ncbi:hypothetical protein AVEN_24436-1 [Araneus ventricosus]|uniref:Secreted protein n=1 Tax=Araneus ventricosus TaxID=182803 RepID=A0A4Y2VV93_ARAVE|nr:hypothetical protein AVEN_24436-1 [Araneus ventricosus]